MATVAEIIVAKTEMLDAAKALDLAEEAVKVANFQRMELYYEAREARELAIRRLRLANAIYSRLLRGAYLD